MLYPEIVVAGCGNTLYGDDGFGPAVVEELLKLRLPENVKVLDAGLGGPHFVFTLLDPQKTRRLVIVDIVDYGAIPGTLSTFAVEDLPPGSYRDAHSWDLTEPLLRLKLRRINGLCAAGAQRRRHARHLVQDEYVWRHGQYHDAPDPFFPEFCVGCADHAHRAAVAEGSGVRDL